MRWEQLEHVLRAASQIAADPDVVVIGSQSIVEAIPEDRLPREATASMEVDVAFSTTQTTGSPTRSTEQSVSCRRSTK